MRNVHDLLTIGGNVAAFPTPPSARGRRPRNAPSQLVVSFFAVNMLAWAGLGYAVHLFL